MQRAVGRLWTLSLFVLLAGCADDAPLPSNARSRVASPEAPAITPAARGFTMDSASARPAAVPGRAADSLAPSMIIRTGQAEVRVDSLEPAIRQVEALARRAGGFIANSSIQSGEGQRRQATLQLKVPAARYEQAMSGLSGFGKLVSATTDAQDVGEEFVDVSARMSNARRLEQRLVTLLATRTGRLEDVLAVERELARVREEIERFEGRLRYLRANVAVSTLTVTLSEPGPVVGEPGSNVMGEAFRQAWRNLVNVVAGLIAALGGLIPLILLAGLGLLAWRRWGAKAKTVSPSE
jgi:hypothetical protein